mgnify:FL=1
MSFTAEIKQEVSYNELKECCTRAELSALLQMTSSLTISRQNLGLLITSQNPTTSKRIMILLKKLYDVDTELRVYQKSNLRKNNVYEILVSNNVKEILTDIGIYSEKGLSSYPRYEIVKKECCARAYIAGVFLAYGSCNSPTTSNYHLEMTTSDESSAAFLIRQLKRFNIEAKCSKRRGKDVVYIKKADAISDFLRCIGAHESLMNFENSRISRDFKNSVVRLGNCEIANAEKSFKASSKQLEAIEKIEKNIKDINPKLKEIMDLRKQFPDESLATLALEYERIYHIRISRSGLKHRLDKILEMAEDIND